MSKGNFIMSESNSAGNSDIPQTDAPSSSKEQVKPKMNFSSQCEGNDSSTEEEDASEDSWLNKLQSFFTNKLHLKEKDIPMVLDEVSVDGIISFIKSDKCKSIITMAGAGISTSAGIPDFRSPDTGLYSNMGKYNLSSPEAVFDIEYFRKNPKPFFQLAKELYPREFKPTLSHYFVKLLVEKGLLLRHYTQNVDTLEHKAGIPADKIVEAHGTFHTSHCISCNTKYEEQWMKDEIFADKIPTCTICSGVVKPDIVFFNEGLPSRFFDLVATDFPKCDLLIIMGTSLTVHPFASLVDNVPPSCPRLLINLEKVGHSNPIDSMLHQFMGQGGMNLDGKNNKRDVALLGPCDEGCSTLVEKLGWKDEFDKLLNKNSSSSI